MANPQSLNTTQKNTIRVVIATGAVLATLFGAQTLALQESSTTRQPVQTITEPSNSVDQGGASTVGDSSSVDDGSNQGSYSQPQSNDFFGNLFASLTQPMPRSRSSR